MLQNYKPLRKYICITLFLLILLTGCSNHLESSNQKAESSIITDNTSAQMKDTASLKHIVVQRGNGKQCRVIFADRKNACVDELLSGITRVLWMEERGYSYPNAKEVPLSTLPEMEEISNLVIKDPPETERYSKNVWYDTVVGSGTWVLIDYDSVETNMIIPRGDIIFYTSNHEDDIAYLAVERTESWQVTQLPGYSDWIARECDIVLRMNALG